MPQRAQNQPICPDCDGFPTVAITTGLRTPNGSRHTVPVTCRTCHGTGTVPRRLTVHAGR
ncbi:hypothetical protein [Streptomyces sp. NPDC101150]|uniref:hypothetical protein n=1 Tax=Streptomyces sp. NPDC101150 TaxID=3366114 RepID=UPI0037F835F8